MPAKSKAQQKFMGLVHAYKKGDIPASKVNKSVKDAAKSMSTKDIKDFANTDRKGLPNKVSKKEFINKFTELLDAEMESCGYVFSAKDPSYKLKSPGGTGEEDKKLKEKKDWGDTTINYKKDTPKSLKKSRFKQLDVLVPKGRVNQVINTLKKEIRGIKINHEEVDSYTKDGLMLSKFKKDDINKIMAIVDHSGGLFESKKIMNEINSYKQFVKYMNDFYGPKGVYPDKKKRTLKMKDIGLAYSVLLKKKPDFEIGYDSTDREMLRDILIKMKKLDPDYSKKESVNEVNIVPLRIYIDWFKKDAKKAKVTPLEYTKKQIRYPGFYGLDKKTLKALLKYFQKNESVNEDVYIGYYKNKKVKVTAKSSKEAQKQIAKKLRVPKRDYDIASIQNLTKTKQNKHKFESVNEMSAKSKKLINKLGKKEKDVLMSMIDMMGFDQVMKDYKRDKKAFKQALKDMSENINEVEKRDYKAEYKKFQSSTKAKKYRAELNKYNRQKGTYGNGDGKDASHKGGKIVGFEKESVNRVRAEKSRLKKEGKLTETKFYAFYNRKKHTIDGKSLYDAKQKAITKLKVPKSKVGLLAIVNAKEHDRGGFRFEQKLREKIREIIKEQLNEAPKPIHHSDMRMLYVPKKDFKNAVKLLRLNIKHGNVEVEKKPSDKVKGFYRFTTTKKMFDDVVTHLAMKKIGVKTIAKGKM